VLNYWAALLGIHPSGLTHRQRADAICYSVMSLPFQFIPLLVTLAQKRDERRRIARLRRALELPYAD
jgi:hypothetical protein